MPAQCLFCQFVSGQLPTETVAQNSRAVAFKDINPQAPVHVLVVPREHYADVATLAQADPAALADLVELAQQVAAELADGQYRLIFNSGPEAGQSIYHVHGHVISGTKLGWTPA